MGQCCIEHIDSYFDEARAKGDLKRYRRKGPTGTTRILVNVLKTQRITDEALLDIGGGIGMIAHELMREGIRGATCIEMSTGAIAASKEEAERQGYQERFTHLHGDALKIVTQVDVSSIVTLDRVLCCYPDMEGLLRAVLPKAGKFFGVSYPRAHWYTKLAFKLENAQRRRAGKVFRAYIHPEDNIRSQIIGDGFVEHFRKKTLLWNIEVYRRQD